MVDRVRGNFDLSVVVDASDSVDSRFTKVFFDLVLKVVYEDGCQESSDYLESETFSYGFT